MEDLIKQEYEDEEMLMEEYHITEEDEEAEDLLHEADVDEDDDAYETENDNDNSNATTKQRRKSVFVQANTTNYRIAEQQSGEVDEEEEASGEEIDNEAEKDAENDEINNKKEVANNNAAQSTAEQQQEVVSTTTTKKRKIIALQDSNFEYFETNRRIALKKKDLEYEEKKQVALEISKYPFIYDVLHPQFNDRNLQQATWQKIAAAVDFSIDKCQTRWHSLKRSARYYATEKKLKAGQHYSHKWPFRDFMKFYTPPSLRAIPVQDSHTQQQNASSSAPPTLSRAPSQVFKRSNITTTASLPTLRPAPKTANRSTTPPPLPTTSRSIELVNPTSPFSESTEFNQDESHGQLPPTQPSTSSTQEKITNEQLSESITTMANTFVAYLQSRSIQTRQQEARDNATRPPLKYLEMWSNFDRLVSKLDEDIVDDLNVEIAQLIGAALKRKRNNEVIID